MEDMDDRAPWSDCPKELLAAIAKRLNCRIDILRVRSVCSWWRSCVASRCHKSHSFLAKLPLSISSLDETIKPYHHDTLTLTEIITYRLEPVGDSSNASGSPKGWLVTIEDGETDRMRFFNPLLVLQEPKVLPSISRKVLYQDRSKLSFNLSLLYNLPMPETLPKVLNLLDFRLSKISRAYDLRYVDSISVPVNHNEKSFFLSVRKTAVSSDPCWTSTSDFAVLVIDDYGDRGLFNPGDEKWTILGDPRARFDDIISYKGQFYCVNRKGRLVMVDSSLEEKEIVPALPNNQCYIKYLVESCGDLLLVAKNLEENLMSRFDVFSFIDERGIGDRYYLEVFKLNQHEHCWVKVESLPDRVLFVGDRCFSMSARVLYGSNGYSRDGYFAAKCRDYAQPNGSNGLDTCVFTLCDGVVGQLDALLNYADLFCQSPE